MTTTHENQTTPKTESMMRTRQRPLMRLYRQEPKAAQIVDGARTVPGAHRRHDAVHGELSIGTSNPIVAPLSIHSAVGGDHDGPNPGDYLGAALVGCFNSTLRVIADRLGIEIVDLNIEAKCEVDVRGTLCVDPDVPVGFTRIALSVDVVPAEGTPPEMIDMLIAGTEHCCVVLQTLKGGVKIDLER